MHTTNKLPTAEQFTKQLQAIQNSVGVLQPSSESLKGMGLRLWQVTLGDEEFLKNVPAKDRNNEIVRVSRELVETDIDKALRLGGALEASDLACKIGSALPQASLMQAIFSAYWVDSACPIIQMPHTYAAALMATDIPADLNEIKPPFTAFLIYVPGGMLSVRDELESRRVEVRYLTVLYQFCELRQRMEWNVTAGTETTVAIFRTGVSTAQLVDADLKFFADTPEADPFCFELDTEDKRTEMLLYRLVVNVCAAMENSNNYKTPKVWSGCKPTKGQKTPPHNRIFKLGKPLELDCRPKLREYLAHGSKRRGNLPLSVQILVRGHWKMQAHGPGRQERKRLWIQPYWKGPDGTPVLLRPVKLTG